MMRNKGKMFELNEKAQIFFANIKKKLCEPSVLGMLLKRECMFSTQMQQ